MPDENVLVITLDDADRARDALAALTDPGGGAGGPGQLRGAAVVHRAADGRVTIGEEVGDIDTAGTFAERHPRLATLLTVLAGPLDTLLLGNTLVALTGAMAEPSPDEVALEHLARAIPPGRTAVIAFAAEADPAATDRALAGLAAHVTRRPLAEVEAELDAASGAVEAAGAEARRVLRSTRPGPR